MPELPEVVTIARTLKPQVIDCRIRVVKLLRAATLHKLSLPPDSLIGVKIADVTQRGKLLLIKLESAVDSSCESGKCIPDTLAVHLRMTGRMVVHAIDTEPNSHTKCTFDLERPDGSMVRMFFDDMRAFGILMFADQSIMAKWSFWTELGPEPFDLDPAGLAARLAGRRPAIKAVLLDQRVLAGIGNIYADESLFQAGIHPERPAASLTTEECDRLLAAMVDVLRRSIAACGSSIRDYRDANGNAGAFQNSFAAYGRGGQDCKICGSKMEKTKVAGRATVYCPNCQTKNGKA